MPETSTTQQGFIFDLDGVVVDTFKYHYQAWRRVADSLGIEFTEAQHHGLQGIGRMASLEKILDHGNIYLPDAEKLHWADVKNNWYVELVAHMTPAEVLPGVREFLEEIKAQNYRTALVSSSRNAGAVLQSTHLDHLFDAVVDGNVIKKPKPDPERYLLAAQSLQLAPAQCTVFEDTLAGVFGAAHSGFFVVGIGKPEQLLYAHCVIPGFTNLTLAELQSKTERVCS
ncbi:MAG: beta-phosphoglucomutase [Saprospiraceae bacterium]|nr:beta-phosphoglucomutase [Saprospiraceae bacterium]